MRQLVRQRNCEGRLVETSVLPSHQLSPSCPAPSACSSLVTRSPSFLPAIPQPERRCHRLRYSKSPSNNLYIVQPTWSSGSASSPQRLPPRNKRFFPFSAGRGDTSQPGPWVSCGTLFCPSSDLTQELRQLPGGKGLGSNPGVC